MESGFPKARSLPRAPLASTGVRVELRLLSSPELGSELARYHARVFSSGPHEEFFVRVELGAEPIKISPESPIDPELSAFLTSLIRTSLRSAKSEGRPLPSRITRFRRLGVSEG